MLSISRIADADYYLGLAREDYYLQGGEPPGIWLGTGAARLALSGQVSAPSLRAVLAGFSVDGSPLIQNAGSPNHQAGWDLTFSAPKSVSVLWSVANEQTRHEIQQAQAAAVRAAVDYLERHTSYSRRGKGGSQLDRAGLVVASFEHATSRAQDPQLHTHCLVANVGVRPDGTTGTLLSRPFYVHKMTAGAVYRAELARALWKLGFAIRSDGSLFEAEGVSQELMREFSKRREAIEQALRAHGSQSSKASEVAALSTRDAKTSLPRAELFEHWRQTAAGHSVTEQSVEKMRTARQPDSSDTRLREVVDEALVQLSRQQSYFARHELLRKTAEAAAAHAFALERMEAIVDKKLADPECIVALGVHEEEPRFTTKGLFDTEERLLQAIERLRTKPCLEVRSPLVVKLLGDKPYLSDEQREAVAHVTTSVGAVHVVNGMPGTGKTTLLRTCREAWEGSGLRVIGCTLSAKAARELAEGSGIQSYTIAKLLHEWDKSLLQKAGHEVQQLARAAQGQTTWQADRLPLDAKAVVVVDEAGMIDTHQMERLLAEVEAHGSRLVLVGDTRQLTPIGPGGAFQAIGARVGHAELLDMRRQRNVRDIEALQALAEGNAKIALESFVLREMLVLCDTKQQAMERLVADWCEFGLLRPQDTAIITTTNREASVINALCQAARVRAAGQSALLAVEVGGDKLLRGDRVIFLENNRLFGVLNGDLGTVVRVHPLKEAISVFMDPRGDGTAGRIVTITLKDYDKLQLGYARTTHKEQGATVENAFVLLGGAMQDKEISFVQASRHREGVRLYADRFEAGHELEGLAMQMELSGAKVLAHELISNVAIKPAAGDTAAASDGDARRAEPTPDDARTMPDSRPQDSHNALNTDMAETREASHFLPVERPSATMAQPTASTPERSERIEAGELAGAESALKPMLAEFDRQAEQDTNYTERRFDDACPATIGDAIRALRPADREAAQSAIHNEQMEIEQANEQDLLQQ